MQARRRLTASEKELSGVIFVRLGKNDSFARIRSQGDKALFGGKTTQQMKDRLGVPAARPLADFLPTITIKAKDFANEITIYNTEGERSHQGVRDHQRAHEEQRGGAQAPREARHPARAAPTRRGRAQSGAASYRGRKAATEGDGQASLEGQGIAALAVAPANDGEAGDGWDENIGARLLYRWIGRRLRSLG